MEENMGLVLHLSPVAESSVELERDIFMLIRISSEFSTSIYLVLDFL